MLKLPMYLFYGFAVIIFCAIGYTFWLELATERGAECRAKGGSMDIEGQCTKLELRHIELEAK